MERWMPMMSRLLLLMMFKTTSAITVTEVKLMSTNPYVIQGEPAYLNCQYLVQPPEIVTEVEWEKDGTLVYLWTLDNPPIAKDILEGHADVNVKSPSMLMINNTHMNMQGTYTCRVRTNGRTAQNEMFLMIIIDACKESAWKTYTDMIDCVETVSMHCIGVFPKPSPACGIYSEKTGKYLNSVPFDSVQKLFNGTYEVSFNRRFIVQDWLNHTDISFRCYMMVLGTTWRNGIRHKLFGDSGCEKDPQTIQHGFYNLTEDRRSCWSFPSEGSKVEYHCDEGYELQGSPVHVCNEGQWTPEGDIVSDSVVCWDINAERSIRPGLLIWVILSIILLI